MFSSKVLILYIVRILIKNWANINKRVGSENGLVKSYSCLKILKIRLILGYETYNKSEFYEETFSLSYSDLLFPLFVLICLHRKNLFSRYSKNWNKFILSYNLSNTIYLVIISNIKRIEFVQYLKWIIAINIKRLANIVIILNPEDKHMVKFNDGNIRNRHTMCLKLTIKVPE